MISLFQISSHSLFRGNEVQLLERGEDTALPMIPLSLHLVFFLFLFLIIDLNSNIWYLAMFFFSNNL
uniref:Uncharacterized protein n=1 Tax=Nelumbo nucifera TaxID=4432 RepID=A0A822ZTF9_NELNU|nr:TPA_asm: hypothetical protein HUJ06_016536 [Nelumbo nucifera]